MNIEPFDWNVVVNGSWNRAILTPAWIATKLFQLPDGTPLQIEVPTDLIGPARVLHDDLLVVASGAQLIVEARRCDFATLNEAMLVARKAITALPHTPLAAAGVNVRYRIDEVPQDLAELTRMLLDGRLSDADLKIQSLASERTVEFGSGLLNISVRISGLESQPSTIILNFHRASSVSSELVDWLNQSTADFDRMTKMVLNMLSLLGKGSHEQYSDMR